ncbi:IS110-like element ISCARN36 family transposase [Thiomonas sp. X19]|uniref:IS110-like element ISCARN36 family transposase n=1 Tax=Thiomonas sp. X19 TaxID=1050370 RepID=UPI000DDA974D|nr:IS110-like element ISCARN36 family transposase [Thiomonas sp. X19]
MGLDLAKSVLVVHGVDAQGKTVLKKQLRRDQVTAYFANLPACLVGMEACGSAHHWARQLRALGHEVRLMAPQFVKPYVKTNKNDAADAQAIGEAVARPSMRFVPVKTPEQQAILALHRARQGFVEERTAHANRIRGLLAEYGLVLPQGIAHIRQRVPLLVDEARQKLPGMFIELIGRLLEHFKVVDAQVHDLEAQIERWAQEQDDCRRLQAIPGIGPITASALVASIGDARAFSSGRQLAAWLGLVPRQHSSGGKNVLLGMSKRGDSYLRTLLIHGARSVIFARQRKAPVGSWLQKLLARCHANVAAVALANKNARTIWALLAHKRSYQAGFVPTPQQG